MRRSAVATLVLAASLLVASRAGAGIDEAYTKPTEARTWGDLLTQFMGQSGFGRSYALVVGISTFDAYPELPTANDPLRMRDYLLQEAGFDYVHVLTDDKATKARIDELMVDVLPGMVGRGDRFLFYWSGHGTQRRIGGRDMGYLPLAHSRRDRFSTMVSMNDLRRWDSLLQAEQALFLLDACFSGLAGSAPKGDNRGATIDQLARPSHHLITAGTGQEQTIAGDHWGGSIFTDAILRAARGAADARTEYEPDGVVSLSELLDYVRRRVGIEKDEAGWTGTITPQRRDLQTSDGEFFFLTTERKVAKLEEEGGAYQGRFEHGVPVVVMSAVREPVPEQAAGDPGQDFQVWSMVRNSTDPIDLETFIETFPDSVWVPFARNRLAGLMADEEPEPIPPPMVDHAAIERALGLGRDQRREVQFALAELGHDPGGIDGILGERSRAALSAWQQAAGEEPTGYLTESQVAALSEAIDPAELARHGPSFDGVYDGSLTAGDSPVRLRTLLHRDGDQVAGRYVYAGGAGQLRTAIENDTMVFVRGGEGEITGVVDGNTLLFSWQEEGQTGRGRLVMAPGGASFSGTWGFDDEHDGGGQWNGSNPIDLETFIERFPDSPMVSFALDRLAERRGGDNAAIERALGPAAGTIR